MIIYNVTTFVDDKVHERWLQWMKSTHLPDIMRTGAFEGYKMAKIINPAPDEGHSYSVQYYATSPEKLEEYQNVYALNLQAEHLALFGDSCQSFRTTMQIVQ